MVIHPAAEPLPHAIGGPAGEPHFQSDVLPSRDFARVRDRVERHLPLQIRGPVRAQDRDEPRLRLARLRPAREHDQYRCLHE